MYFEQPSWTAVQTSPQDTVQAGVTAAALAFGVFLVGTGGLDSQDTVLALVQGTGSIPSEITAAVEAHETGVVNEKVDAIRSALQLSIAQLAKMFNVSRPTIYSWLSGKPASKENERRINELASALAPQVDLLMSQPSRPGSRAICGNQSMVDLMVAGCSPQESVDKLVSVLRAESSQSELLAQRLAARRTRRGIPDIATLG